MRGVPRKINPKSRGAGEARKREMKNGQGAFSEGAKRHWGGGSSEWKPSAGDWCCHGVSIERGKKKTVDGAVTGRAKETCFECNDENGPGKRKANGTVKENAKKSGFEGDPKTAATRSTRANPRNRGAHCSGVQSKHTKPRGT